MGQPGLSLISRVRSLIVSKEGARPISPTYTSRRPKGYRKALAQYFLTDQRVLSYILEAADLSSQDTVVEVGSGRGILTRQLTELARRVVAVEIDAALAAGLATKLGNPPNLTVLEADARTADIQPDVPYKLVANLPYYAANPIIRRFLEMDRQPLRMVVMVQKEVAMSMTATPGRMTLLSVAVQFYGMPRLVCVVPPSAFRPSPKVDSAVVCIDVEPEARGQVDDEARFFRLARAGFAAPRKQLRNSLALGLGINGAEASKLLQRADIDSRRRPGTLTVSEWISLYKSLPEDAIQSSDGEETSGRQ